MTPRLISFNAVSLSCGYSVILSDLLARHLIGEKPNFLNLSLGKFCTWVFLSAKNTFVTRRHLKPSFFHGVMGIVLRSAKKQVLRIATAWIVAAMKNPVTFWNFFIRQQKSDAMCSDCFSKPFCFPVASCRDRTDPGPTVISKTHVNVGQKPTLRGSSFPFVSRFHSSILPPYTTQLQASLC